MKSKISAAEMKKAVAAVNKHGGPVAAARALGLTRNALDWRLQHAARAGMKPEPHPIDREAAKQKETRTKRENKLLMDELKVHRERERVASRIENLDLPKLPPTKLGSAKRDGTPVILASDWHVEETVRPTQYSSNRYTLKIAEQRIGRLFAGARWLVDFHRPIFGCRHVVLWLGGDLITGHIHDELVESTRGMAPLDTIDWLFPRCLYGIDTLLEDRKIEHLSVVFSYGNHGRDTRKPRRDTGAAHSYEYAMYRQIVRHYEGNKRVRPLLHPSGHQYLKVYDFDLHFHHGDEIQYGGGVGGISIPGNKAVAQWDKWRKADFHHFGHFHQYLDLGQAVFNGSLIGTNAYSMSIKATPEPPQQAFYILDSKRGKTCKSPIWVGA